MDRVIDYTGLESKAIDAKNIQIVFQKGEKLELALDKVGKDFQIKVCTPGNNSNYTLKQCASEEKARTDFEKYLKKLESGRYALHITDQTTAKLVLNQRYTTSIARIIRGKDY